MILPPNAHPWPVRTRALALALLLLPHLAGATPVGPAADSRSAAAPAAPALSDGPIPPVPGASTTPQAWRAREGAYFKRTWGTEIIGIHTASSGYMLTFRYRVLDPALAKPLNDQKAKAYVIDEATGVRLAVPAMENVGELRQTTQSEADKTYFIVFGNPGKLVKPGGRVTVVIGRFHVPGLIVE
jgi:hypothetical protein